MSFLQRVEGIITQKQIESIDKLVKDTNNYLIGSNNFFNKLTDRIYGHTESNLFQHFSAVVNYLMTDDLGETQNMPISIQNAQQLSKRPQEISSKSEDNVEKDNIVMLVQEQQQNTFSIDYRQRIESNNKQKYKNISDNNNNSRVNLQQSLTNERNQVSQIKKNQLYSNIEKYGQKNTIESVREGLTDNKRYDRSLSVDDKQTLSFNMNVSNLISKKQGIQDLPIKRQHRNTQKQAKSRKLRTHLVKLEPIARQKQKKMKQRQASEKISAAMQFFNTIQNRKKCASYKITEWRQDRSYAQGLSKMESSPINYNFKKIDQYKNKYQLSASRETQIQQKIHLTEIKKRENKSTINEEKFVLTKPPPYNLYNIHLHKHQVFQLPSK